MPFPAPSIFQSRGKPAKTPAGAAGKTPEQWRQYWNAFIALEKYSQILKTQGGSMEKVREYREILGNCLRENIGNPGEISAELLKIFLANAPEIREPGNLPS